MADVNLQSITFPGLDDRYVIPSGGTTEIFWATYGTTTNAEIEAAYQAEMAILCIYNKRTYLMVERTSATDHLFWCEAFHTGYSLECNANTWTNGFMIPPSASSSTPAALGTASAGSSSQYSRGDHVHPMPSASDVGAIAAPSSPTSGQFLVYNGTAWVAQTLPLYNGGVS